METDVTGPSMNARITSLEPDARAAALLTDCGLDAGDLADNVRLELYGLDRMGHLAALVGLEHCAPHGLLRSLAVAPAHRGRGHARRLVAHVEQHAHRTGITGLYLLTETAEDFFASLGYRRIERQSAPATVQATEQFRNRCPASAACMVKLLGEPATAPDLPGWPGDS